MDSELFELCDSARERMTVPVFPLASIRSAAQRPAHPARSGRKRSITAIVAVGLSILTVAAAAELAAQSHIRFTPSGGMVLTSSANMGSHPIHSDAEVPQAAGHLNFRVVLPAGLPAGATPIRLFTSGSDVMAVTYDLPGAWRSSHHLLWIFLANSAALGTQTMTTVRDELRPDDRMSQWRWRTGGEEVIVISNGLTRTELETMKAAMTQETR
jgi:hypothetical protein